MRFVKRDFVGHEVHTVEEAEFQDWKRRPLTGCIRVYDVLVTVDQNLPYQQNLAGLDVAILILAANRNSYARMKLLLPRALRPSEPGDVIRIEQ